MSLTRDAHKQAREAMATIVRAGAAAGKLAGPFRWHRLTSEEVQMQGVLRRVEAEGWAARDVLNQMEENDG